MKHLLTSLLFLLLIPLWGLAQNGIIGDGFGTDDWTTTDDFYESAGNSRIGTFNPKASDKNYFRLVTNWNGNDSQWGPSSTTEDYQVSIGAEVPSTEIIENSTDKAYYINSSNTSYNYVFKTKASGNPPANKGLRVFEVAGAIQTISSVSQSPSSVSAGEEVTVTATCNNLLNAGQGVYLRYTNDNWSTSSVIEMTVASGSDYTADIAAGENTAGNIINYYVFTSGDALSIAPSDADWYTINLNNKSGNNYTYSIPYTTAQAGNWSNKDTWATGNVPSTGDPVEIAHDVTLNQDAEVGDFSIASGATFTGDDGSGKTLSIQKYGGFKNNGTFDAAGGTVEFLDFGSVTGTVAFHHVMINGGVDFGTNSTVNGTLTINSGGYVNTNCPTYANASTLKYTSTYATGAEWANAPGNVVISGISRTVTFESNQTVNNDLTIENASNTLIVESGYSLTVKGEITNNGAITNNGTLTLASTGTGVEETATLLDNGTVNSDITVERHVAQNSWYYISPGVSGATSDVFTPNEDNGLFYWEEANSASPSEDGWSQITNTTTNLNAMQGYAYKRKASDATLSFTGTLNTGSQSISLSRNPGNYKEGYNLVGNPYPSYIDVGNENDDGKNITNTNLSNTIWMRSNGNITTYNMYTGADANDGSRYIAPQQGFWMLVESGETSGTYEIDNTARIAADNVSNQNQGFLTNKSTEEHLLRLEVSRGELKDELVIGFYGQAQKGFDKYDSPKMFATDERYGELYAPVEGRKLAINGLPQLQENLPVTVGFKTQKAGEFTIEATNLKSFSKADKVYLEDTQTGEVIDLRKKGSYRFTTNGAVDDAGRFKVLFTISESTGLPTSADEQVQLFNQGKQLYIKQDKLQETRIRIFNSMGQQLMDTRASWQGMKRLKLNATPGVYMVQLKTPNDVNTHKIMIQ